MNPETNRIMKKMENNKRKIVILIMTSKDQSGSMIYFRLMLKCKLN